MLRASVHPISSSRDAFSDDVTSQVQAALAALADLETRYQIDRDALVQWSGSEALKKRFLGQLEAHRAREREPLVLRLAALHQHMTAACLFRDLRFMQ
jgi:hypothetical protein